MKKWNSPEIEVLDIKNTENGYVPAFSEKDSSGFLRPGTNPGAGNLVSSLIDAIESLVDNNSSSNKGDSVTPDTKDDAIDELS